MPSDALLQHLPSTWVSLTLDEGYLLTATVPELQRGIAALGPPVPEQPPLLGLLLPTTNPGLGHGWLLPAAAPGLGLGVAPQGHSPWPRARGGFSQLPLTLDMECPSHACGAIQTMPAGQPEMGGSWWRGLTECGPL